MDLDKHLVRQQVGVVPDARQSYCVSIPQVLDDGSFKYVYGLGRIAEVGPGTTTHYYLPDGLGSTMALVDSSGSAANTYDYDVFGAIRTSTGSQANEFKFTGEQVDEVRGCSI
jgi:hypothetical protein